MGGFGRTRGVREYRAGDDRLLLLDAGEWDAVLSGKVREIDGVPVAAVVADRNWAVYALERGAASSDRVQLFLGTHGWHRSDWVKWWPRLLYWPDGRPDLGADEQPDSRRFFDVYFHRFHCFECALDMDGYAIDNLARHRWTPEDAAPVRGLIKRCPRCGGDVRDPGLIEITHLHHAHGDTAAAPQLE